MAEPGKRRIFISHAKNDGEWVAALRHSLQREGLSVWLDAADQKPGATWEESAGQALRDSDAVLFVVDREAARTPTALFELGAALGGRKRIVPIAREAVDVDELPSTFRRLKWLHETSAEMAGRRVADLLNRVDESGR